MNARERWKMAWRTIRVMKREALKAHCDLMIYGTGVICIPKTGDPHHIPLREIRAPISGGLQ